MSWELSICRSHVPTKTWPTKTWPY